MKDNRITVTDIPNTNLKNYFEERLLEVVLLNMARASINFDAKQK